MLETVPIEALPPASAAPGNPPRPGNPLAEPERNPPAALGARPVAEEPPSAGGVNALAVLEELES
jgi:hypothetical protein